MTKDEIDRPDEEGVYVNELTNNMVRSAVYHWMRKNDPEVFEAWLNQVKAEAWEEGYAHGNADAFTEARLDRDNPYRQGEEQ